MKISREVSFSAKMKKGLSEKGITMRSAVAFLIFGMIILVFVFTDLSGPNSGGMSMGSAAEVNGEFISLKDFQEEEERLAQYYSQLFGGQFNSEVQRKMLRGEVLNSLISKALAAQAAENEGIYATDQELRYMITNELSYFKKDGVFQSDIYKSVLQANRLTPSEFEKKLRKDIQNQRSRQLFETSLSTLGLQKETEALLRSSKLNLEYVQLSAKDFAKTNGVTPADVASKLSDESFKKRVADYYNSNQSLYETPEQVRASHILIKSDGTNDQASLEKAKSILIKSQTESFEKLATDNSDDPGSKSQKGDLGYFKKGQMVKEFEEAAFSLPIGKISELVKTSFGYHIIKVTGKKPYSKLALESVEAEIAKKLIVDDQYLSMVTELEKLLQNASAEEVQSHLAKNKLAWKETGYFDLSAEVAPQINSAQAIKLALELSANSKIAKQLVREGETQFLIKLKDLKSDVAAPKIATQDLNVLEKQSSMQVYTAWIENFKKTAKINTNSALIAQ